jgi:hypothetical protein
MALCIYWIMQIVKLNNHNNEVKMYTNLGVVTTGGKLPAFIESRNNEIIAFTKTELSNNVKRLNLGDFTAMAGQMLSGNFDAVFEKVVNPTINPSIAKAIAVYEPLLIYASVGIFTAGFLAGALLVYLAKR